jgi:hypothetical protein
MENRILENSSEEMGRVWAFHRFAFGKENYV